MASGTVKKEGTRSLGVGGSGRTSTGKTTPLRATAGHHGRLRRRCNRHAWASPPSKPMLSRDGEAVRDGADKIRYVPIIMFASKELRDKFSNAIVDAMLIAHPE